MSEIFLDHPFSELWSDTAVFSEVAALQGEEFRHVKSRKTFRIEIDGKGFFVKHHYGVGWREIIKDLLQFKKPVTGARGEFEAIRHLERFGVPTMECAAFGERFFDPAAKESFIITRELADMESLEDFCADWCNTPPSPELRRDIIKQLARSVGTMHASGLNHRDCYICHFLRSAETGKLHVIDLHRAQIRKKVPFRYAVKDVAGIFFSAMDSALTAGDVALFLHEYKKCGNSCSKVFLKAVKAAAEKLYFKEHKKCAPEIIFDSKHHIERSL